MTLVAVKPAAILQDSHTSLDELVEAFLAAQDVAESSKKTYGRQMKQFVEWLSATNRDANLGGLQREDILAYKKWLIDSGKSSYTVSGYITAVRKFFQYLESRKIYPDVTRGIKGAKKAKGFRKDCLTNSQIREVLANIDTSNLVGLRDYAIINLMVRTGLRTIEVARAGIGDLRQESGEAVLWVQGKGRDAKDEFVLLVDAALKPIHTYLAARGAQKDDEPLFASESDRNPGRSLTTRSISRIVKEAFRNVGLNSPRLTAHSLRHTSCTLSILGGAKLEQVQSMARHRSPTVTSIYIHNISRVADGAEKYISF